MCNFRFPRKLVSVVSAIIIAAALPVAVSSAEPTKVQTPQSQFFSSPNSISPQWPYTSSATATISKSGSTVKPRASIRAAASNYQISGTLYLERLNGSTWVTVDKYSLSGSSSILQTEEYNNASKGTYRSRFVVYVNGEYVTATSDSVTV